MKRRIMKDDVVVVISGAHKPSDKDGQRKLTTGKVLKVDRRKEKVYIEGVNVRKVAKKKSQTDAGGLIEMECPLHISNVMLLDRYNSKMAGKDNSAGDS